jgi:hypothetical protein
VDVAAGAVVCVSRVTYVGEFEGHLLGIAHCGDTGGPTTPGRQLHVTEIRAGVVEDLPPASNHRREEAAVQVG